MRCEAEKKAVEMFSYVMPFETLDKHGGIIGKAKKYRNRKLLKKYCYYQAEGREGETQRDRKREWEREGEREREMQTIDLACSRGAKKTFCITITHTDRIIIECERDVENEIGIAQATRRRHRGRHSWRETKPNWFHFATKLSNTKINQMMTKKQRQRRRRRRWWRLSDDDDDDLALLLADLQVHHSALAVAANYSNNTINSSNSRSG